MFGLSMSEIVVILIIALLLFGPKKLPDFARKLGQMGKEIKNACHVFKEEIDRPDESSSKKDSENNNPPQPPQG